MKLQLFITIQFSLKPDHDHDHALRMYKVLDVPFVPRKGISFRFTDFWPEDYEESCGREFQPIIRKVYWWNVEEVYWEAEAEERNMYCDPEDRDRIQERLISLGWILEKDEPAKIEV